MLVKSYDVVVGDIMMLDTGDKIIADCLVVSTQGLIVDEASLTGESDPIKKDENDPWVRSGTQVRRTREVVVVVVGGRGGGRRVFRWWWWCVQVVAGGIQGWYIHVVAGEGVFRWWWCIQLVVWMSPWFLTGPPPPTGVRGQRPGTGCRCWPQQRVGQDHGAGGRGGG